MATKKTISRQVPLADSEEERLVPRLEVIARLGVSGETLRQWRIAGKFVPVRVGARLLRYRERDVRRIIRRGLPTTAA
jgi:hypothetical protein